MCGRSFSKVTILKQITKAYGEKFDMLNLQFIQRSKRYFSMEPAAIYALLIPMNYKLRKEEITHSWRLPTAKKSIVSLQWNLLW